MGANISGSMYMHVKPKADVMKHHPLVDCASLLNEIGSQSNLKLVDMIRLLTTNLALGLPCLPPPEVELIYLVFRWVIGDPNSSHPLSHLPGLGNVALKVSKPPSNYSPVRPKNAHIP